MVFGAYSAIRQTEEGDAERSFTDSDTSMSLPHHSYNQPLPAWKRPRKTSRLAITAVILCALILGLEVAHYTTGEGKVPAALKTVASVTSWTKTASNTRPKLCNPYDYHGVLTVSNEPQENVFTPILAPADCQVENLMLGLIRKDGTADFVRNKTIVFFGDSIDRNLNSDICGLTGGSRIMVSSDSPLSPPYPAGEGQPPADYVNMVDGDNSRWPDNTESRPWLCYYEHYNFLIVNVFHFGFRPETNYISHVPHFYPPGLTEDRFDQIIVPLMENVAAEYGVSPVPDIITFTPGFWTIKRTKYELVNGTSLEEGGALQPMVSDWDPENVELVDWFVARLQMTIEHIAQGWSEAPKRPLILWRSLPHIPGNGQVTQGHAHALDQIGLAVVRTLVREGKAAKSRSEWKKWLQEADTMDGWIGHSRSEAREMDLGDRLLISRWADIILGAQTHLRDAVHPDVLPAGQLYGNMLLQQLKIMAAEA